MVSPIVDERRQPQGLIGAGISLQCIQKIAQGLQAGETGYGFVLSKDGTFIFHPEDKFIMQYNIADLEDKSIQALGASMISGASGMLPYSLGEKAMVAFYQPIPITGWSVATVLPEAELFAPAIKMIKVLTIITFVFIILVGTAILLAMQRLTRPLQSSLASQAQEISSGNLDVPALEIEANDELGKLSHAFNTMMTNLKKTMQGLRQSEDNYRSVFENSLLGIMQTSPDGKLLNANPAMVRMLGYESLEIMKAALTDIQLQLYANPDDRNEIILHLLEHGKVQGQEVQFMRCNTHKIWVNMNIALIRNVAGDPIRIESLVTDISARKKAEHEREVMQGQLAQAQKLEAVGKLAGGVAHDFNNMLSVIIGKTELALMNVKESDPFYKTFLDIRKAADHSANLTRQLLTFARKQTVAPQVINLNEVLSEMLNMLRRIIGEDIELVQTHSIGLWPVEIDPDQVGQILANLCINARDAVGGIGTIVIETKNCSFDAAHCAKSPDSQPGDYVCLSVSDDGCGIDKEAMGHIFEPFFTTKGIDKGTGLGLATVYGIVKQNGGHINTHSEVGHGTTFKLYLPRYQGEDKKLLPKKSQKVIAHGHEMILLVEDEVDLLHMVKDMLEELGYAVLATNTPEEAIRLAEEHSEKIDLLLTDVVMPKMNGRDLAALLMANQPGMKCLFMSGYTANIITKKGVLDDDVNFIHKPFSIQELAVKVRQIIDIEAKG